MTTRRLSGGARAEHHAEKPSPEETSTPLSAALVQQVESLDANAPVTLLRTIIERNKLPVSPGSGGDIQVAVDHAGLSQAVCLLVTTLILLAVIHNRAPEAGRLHGPVLSLFSPPATPQCSAPRACCGCAKRRLSAAPPRGSTSSALRRHSRASLGPFSNLPLDFAERGALGPSARTGSRRLNERRGAGPSVRCRCRCRDCTGSAVAALSGEVAADAVRALGRLSCAVDRQ
eukprot:scaffold98762_cov69-Phaeocystis_antarctica.AAC.1